MIFLFKKQKIHVDVFTKYSHVYEFFKIQNSVKYIPEWWKNVSKEINDPNRFVDYIPVPTIRSCPGFLSYYKVGYILPLWSDLIIKTTNNNYFYQFASSFSTIDDHDPIQTGKTFVNYHHLKIGSPWIFKSKSQEKFFCTMPSWNLPNFLHKIHILPGVVEFKINRSLNINLFIPKKEDRIILEAKTPLYHVLPLSEKKIEFHHHLVTDQEIFKLSPDRFTFTNWASTSKKLNN